jgi:hypothetical protein
MVFDGDDEALPLIHFVLAAFRVCRQQEEILDYTRFADGLHHEAAFSV